MNEKIIRERIEKLGCKLDHIKAITYTKSELLNAAAKEIAQDDKVLEFVLGSVTEQQEDLSEIILDYIETINNELEELIEQTTN